MTSVLPYGRQSVSEADIAAVVDVLRSDFLTGGEAVPRFEAMLAEKTGAKHAVACANGTAALHLACLAAGLSEGGTGLTQALTFAASANAMLYCGARASLCDVDAETLGLSPALLSQASASGPSPDVVIPVAYAGLSTLDADLRAAAGDAVVIEDGCHALGGTRADGAPVGAGSLAHMTCFSFHPVKPITSGEGGAVVTDDAELARRLRLFRSHGIERDPARFEGGDRAPWIYEQQALGFNYRMTDIQAALGASQLARLDDFIARRRHIARAYDGLLADTPGLTPVQNADAMRARSGCHLYAVRIDFAGLERERAQVMAALRQAGIGTQVHYLPVYKHPYHRPAFPDAEARFPQTERYYREALSLPCFPDMTDGDIERAATALKGALAP